MVEIPKKIHKIHRVIHIYTNVILWKPSCQFHHFQMPNPFFHPSKPFFRPKIPSYNHSFQNRSTRFATVLTVTVSNCSHSLGNSLR